MADSIQTSIGINPPIGLPGLEYDSSFSDVVTKIAAETIPFGSWVSFTAEETCELPDDATEAGSREGGVALLDQNKPSGVGYVAGDPVRVMRRGRVWVAPEHAVTNVDPVYVRHTAAGAEKKGAFRKDADTTDASIPTGAKWFKGGSTLAVLELGVGGSPGPQGEPGA
jgi:phage tail sheath protein FI